MQFLKTLESSSRFALKYLYITVKLAVTLKSRANRQLSVQCISERKRKNLRKQYENKTLLIPDILIHKSPLAVHRLPMRGFTARNTLLPGSHRASTGVFPSVHGVSGPETGCMP